MATASFDILVAAEMVKLHSILGSYRPDQEVLRQAIADFEEAERLLEYRRDGLQKGIATAPPEQIPTFQRQLDELLEDSSRTRQHLEDTILFVPTFLPVEQLLHIARDTQLRLLPKPDEMAVRSIQQNAKDGTYQLLAAHGNPVNKEVLADGISETEAFLWVGSNSPALAK